jgi:hypothetical protein
MTRGRVRGVRDGEGEVGKGGGWGGRTGRKGGQRQSTEVRLVSAVELCVSLVYFCCAFLFYFLHKKKFRCVLVSLVSAVALSVCVCVCVSIVLASLSLRCESLFFLDIFSSIVLASLSLLCDFFIL